MLKLNDVAPLPNGAEDVDRDEKGVTDVLDDKLEPPNIVEEKPLPAVVVAAGFESDPNPAKAGAADVLTDVERFDEIPPKLKAFPMSSSGFFCSFCVLLSAALSDAKAANP